MYCISKASDTLIFVDFPPLERFGEVVLCDMGAMGFSHNTLKIV